MPKLFAVYLGGSAPKANIEIHDVVFASGETIEDTYEQLLDKWLGTPIGLHLDSWIELDIIDGFKISLTRHDVSTKHKLYFINFGSYRHGQFMEFHINKFLVGENDAEVKVKAKRQLHEKFDALIHTDDLYDLDECLRIENVNDYRIALKPTNDKVEFLPSNRYHIIPKNIVETYLVRHPGLQRAHHAPLNKIK